MLPSIAAFKIALFPSLLNKKNISVCIEIKSRTNLKLTFSTILINNYLLKAIVKKYTIDKFICIPTCHPYLWDIQYSSTIAVVIFKRAIP